MSHLTAMSKLTVASIAHSMHQISCYSRRLMSRMLLAAVLVVLLLGASVSRAADPSDGTAAATPDVKVAVQQLLEDAKSHLAASKYNEALDCYDQASEKDSRNYMIYFRRAATYLTLGRMSNALRDFERVLEIRPNFDQALLQRGKLLLKSCDLKGAMTDLNQYLQSHPADTVALEALANAQMAETDMRDVDANISAKSYEAALENISRLSSTCSLVSDYRLKRIDIYLEMGEKVMAVGDLTRVAQLHPDDTVVLNRLIKLQIDIGETSAALSTLKECLKQDPEHKICKSIFRDLKKLDKLSKAVDTSMEFANWKSVIQKLFGDNDVVGFVAEAERIGSLEHRRKAYSAACRAYTEMKDAAKALKWCAMAVDADPGNIDALCNRAEAHIMSEDYEEAVRDYEKAHEINKQDRKVIEGYHKAQRLAKAAKKKDYYKILGVSRTESKRGIKKAYRKLAQEWHPDKYKGDLPAEAVLKKMSDINEAYETLTDDEKREQFDNGVDPNDNSGQQSHQGHPFFFQHGGHPFGGGNPFGGGGSPFGGQFQFHF